MEVRIGYDGIVFASDVNGPAFAFTPGDIYNAIAAQVLKDGAIVANPHTQWAEFNPNLPAQDILVLAPGTRHGTREVFDTRVIVAGCEETGAMQAFMDGGMDEDAAEEACMQLRTDGRSIDIDGDYTETLARLDADKNAIGVFGLSFYQNNTDKLQVATMSGVTPSTETIASGEYPVSRPLYFYVKMAHLDVIPACRNTSSSSCRTTWPARTARWRNTVWCRTPNLPRRRKWWPTALRWAAGIKRPKGDGAGLAPSHTSQLTRRTYPNVGVVDLDRRPADRGGGVFRVPGAGDEPRGGRHTRPAFAAGILRWFGFLSVAVPAALMLCVWMIARRLFMWNGSCRGISPPNRCRMPARAP